MALAAIAPSAGCAFSPSDALFSYDADHVTVQYLNLFNQKAHKGVAKRRSWSGDWVFRRERLALIDSALRNIKPDILFFGEMLQKNSSPYDDDRVILSAGALQNHGWQAGAVKTHREGDEIESLAIVTAPPTRRDFMQLGRGPAVTGLVAEGEAHMLYLAQEIAGQQTLFVNVDIPRTVDLDRQFSLLNGLLGQAREIGEQAGVCPSRVIVGSHDGIPPRHASYQELLERHRLQDSAAGRCKNPSDCYSASPQNELFLRTFGDVAPESPVKIMAGKGVIIYEAGLNFEGIFPVSPYARKYELGMMFMSHEFGWRAIMRLPRCSGP